MRGFADSALDGVSLVIPLKELDEPALEQVETSLHRKRLEAGEFLCRPGEHGESLFLAESGPAPPFDRARQLAGHPLGGSFRGGGAADR
jgi:hypothetical protein